jgi:hypothetical protein
MSASTDQMQKWFDGLSSSEQQSVVEFLYGGRVLLKEGLYCGPRPGSVQRGLHCGPIPASAANKCPTCGKPY